MANKEGETEMNNTANARQLALVAERTPERGQTDALIKAALSLSHAIEALGTLNLLGELSPPDVKGGIDFYEEVARFEHAILAGALRLAHGRQRDAAALLGLNATTLNCMIKRHGIDAAAFSNARGAEPRCADARESGGNVRPLHEEAPHR